MISIKQKEFISASLPRMTIVEGCISSGKTFICNHKAIEHIANNYTKQGLIFFVGRTLTTLERNVLEPLALQYKGDFKYSLNQKKASLCGVRIELEGCNDISAEAKIRGSTAEFIYGDELTLWNKPFLIRCMGSLRTPKACFLGTTNPDTPLNFVKTDYLDRQEELGLQNVKFDMAGNPTLTPEYIAQVDKEYVGVFHDRFIKGLWVRAEGVIYPMFNEDQHTFTDTPNEKGAYYISVDYGTYNAFAAALWFHCTDDGISYMLKEYHHDGRETNTQKDDVQYYKAIESLAGGYPIQYIIVDPSASSFIVYIMHQQKFHVAKAANSVVDGIRHTATAFNKGWIKIHKSCKNMIRELKSYSWDDKSLSEDKPLKVNDHQVDQLRYYVMTGMRQHKMF